MLCSNIDPELLESIVSVEEDLSGNIKRGFTNIGVKSLNLLNHDEWVEWEKFDVISLKERNNHITISNLQFKQCLNLRMLKTVSDLKFNVLDVIIDLNNVTLVGDYNAFNLDLIETIPIPLQGKLEITLENVRAYGFIGFTGCDDFFVSTNYDLEYETGPIQTIFEYGGLNGNRIIKTIRKNRLDETLVRSFQIDLMSRIQNSIKRKLDTVLGDLSILDTFRGDTEIVEKYFAHSVDLDQLTNSFIDRFIAEIINDSKNSSVMRISDFETTFDYTVGVVTLNGEFNASNGYAECDVRTLRRYEKFTLFQDRANNLVTIFGGIGLDKLQFGYHKYISKLLFLEPRGDIKMSAENNLIFLKINTPTFPDFTHIKYELRIERLEQIEYQISGLNGGPLDWLISRIEKWMMGRFKIDVAEIIEEELRNSVNSFLGRNNNVKRMKK